MKTIIFQKLFYFVVPFLSLLSFSSCDNMFDYNPYDANVKGETNINAKNISRIESICNTKDTIRFVFLGDSHRNYDEAEHLVSNINKRADVDFVIHGGDISEYGVTKEFMWHRNILSHLNVPYVALIGNHDCLGTGEAVFRKIWGKENFTFRAGKIRFTCLNTNALEYDYSNPVPDFDFIDQQIADSAGISYNVVVMHSPPFSEQFNNNVANTFEKHYLKLYKNLLFCLHAHCHKLLARDLYGDGLMYYGCSCFADKNYMLFTIYPDGKYTYEIVQL